MFTSELDASDGFVDILDVLFEVLDVDFLRSRSRKRENAADDVVIDGGRVCGS